MEYVTGMHALNTACSLQTTGDWHTSALQWARPTIASSSELPLGNWGIEQGVIPQEDGSFTEVYKANHLRAILDILCGVTGLQPSDIKFFKKNWICTDVYDTTFIRMVEELRSKGAIHDWKAVDSLMAKEFGRKWTRRGMTENSTELS